MARRDLEFNMDEGLTRWQRWLLSLQREEMENTLDRIKRTAALRLVEHLDDLTPVRQGPLRQSMSMGGRGNVFEIKTGQESYVFVGTAVKYAAYVNDGFTQKAGQFVPGYWSSGTFHYQRNYDGGMVLKGKIIPGAHMFEKSMDYLKNGELKQIIDFEFRRLYAQLFGGGGSQ